MGAGGHEIHEGIGEEGGAVIRKRRSRPRRWYQKLPRWLKEYSIEIGLTIAVLAAIFLLVEPWDIRVTLFRWARRIYQGLMDSLSSAGSTVVNWAKGLTLSDATAVGILVLVMFVAVWRVRWRIVRSERLWSTSCPRCGLAELHRIRRNLTGRLLFMLGLPVARYRCGNCAWVGLRIRRGRAIPPDFLDPAAF